MATGRITSIRADRGFGFIADSSESAKGNEVFFHRSAVIDTQFEALREGQEVEFEAGPDPRDPTRVRAKDVRVITADES